MNYIKQSVRNIKNKPSLFLTNLSGLSVAFTAFILIALFVINEFHFDKFNTKGERIYRIESGEENQLPLAVSRLAKKEFPEIENTTVIKTFNNPWIKYNENFIEVDDMCFAENSFFQMFSVPFITGDPKEALNKPYTIVLSESLAKIIFGDKNPVGEQIYFKGQNYYTVTGIIKDLPDFHLPSKAIASFQSVEDRYNLNDNTWNWSLVSYVLLHKNVDAEQLEIKLNEFFGSMNQLKDYDESFVLRPFNSIYLATDTTSTDETKHGNYHLLIILCLVSILIIFIASVNLINLSISEGIRKMQDIVVKRIMGGSRSAIFFQHIVDSIILCLVALFVASFFVFLLLEGFENLIGKHLNIEQIFNLKYVSLAFFGILILSIIYGFFPGYILTRKDIQHWKKGGQTVTKSKGFYNGLVIFQYTVSIILILGTSVIYKQLGYISNKDLGFNDEQLLCVDLSSNIKRNLKSFESDLSENPNIKGLSFVSDNVTQFNQYSNTFDIDNKRISMNYAEVDPDFIPLLRMNIIQGDNFSWNVESQINKGYIINEAAWNLIKNTSIKEKSYELNNRSLIGVVSDFHFESFHSKIHPMILYWQSSENSKNKVLIKLSGHNVTGTLQHIENTLKNYAPNSLHKYQFVNQEFDYLYHLERLLLKLFGIFSLLAIFIALLGIIAISKIITGNRIKEIGIRKVNGAKISDILAMLNKNIVKWILIALVIASPLARYIMQKWLENYAYKTELSWWLFALSGCIALSLTLITVSWQSLRAATRNPVEALRYE